MVYSIVNELPEGAKGRCQHNTHQISAWAAAHAVADEVEVPCRAAGLTIRIQKSEFRISRLDTTHRRWNILTPDS